MKASQAASVLEELARVFELSGGKASSTDMKALAAYLREAPANDLTQELPPADPKKFASLYLNALRSAGTNRQLFDAVYSVLKVDKTIDAEAMVEIAKHFSTIPKLKGRPKALKAIQDRFETLVQRERKQRDIDRLTDG